MSDRTRRRPRSRLQQRTLVRADALTPESKALASLEEAIGGRAALQQALVQIPPTGELEYAINAIADPTNDARSLAVICAEAGISVGELLEAYKRGVMARATVLAITSVAEGAAPVTQDLMRRAAPYTEPCGDCAGTGTVTADPTDAVPNPSPEPCRTCQGAGSLSYLPELARQKVALELIGLLGQKAGTSINITQANQQVAASVRGDAGALARLHAATDQVLYRDPRPEGEIVEAEDPEA
jgi:hypothetical protein